MMGMRARTLTALTASALCLAAGCNAILGNEEGTPRATFGGSEGGALDASVGDADDRLDGKVVADAAFDAALACPSDKKACSGFGACVVPTDPNYGCGDPSCLACDTTNAKSVSCVGSSAGIVCKLDCSAGFSNCDGKNDNGCEADLAKATTCGSCSNACPPGQYCSNTAGLYACVGACPLTQEACGTECINKDTNPSHCGGCSKACAAPANATATCMTRTCGFQCEKLYHQCGVRCVADSEASECGTACRDCKTAAPPNTQASCQAGGCVFECAPGWGDCNGEIYDGCESDLLNTSAHCAKCENACPTGGIIFTPNVPSPDTFCCNGSCISTSYACAVKQ